LVRVMGGVARGRNLKSPAGLEFRPTTGRVKEFLFNVLQMEVGDAVVLDLFSGTGSLGIEAISRGAAHVTFVEQSPSSLKLLRENLSICQFESQATVLSGDVFQQLESLGRQEKKFDLVLADPPFKENYRARIIKSIDENVLIGDQGRLIVEHEQHDPAHDGGRMAQYRQNKFGACTVSFYGVQS